jgi:hypothetical protein
MSVWAALAGGFVGTLVLTTMLSTASEFGLTRMDLPFLLGTILTSDRSQAKAVGYAMHFGIGLLFALVYFFVFRAVGESGWAVGALFGLIHGLFASIALVNVLLPVVHPRMGTPMSAAADRPLLEPPGFLMLNYGRRTPVVTIAGHITYGAIIGGFLSLAG